MSIKSIKLEYSHPRGEVSQVELDNGEVWNLKGECNRCGKCCEKVKMTLPEFAKEDGTCKHLSYETENGVKQAKCAIMWARPIFCALYPRDPYEKLPDECSYSWEKIK